MGREVRQGGEEGRPVRVALPFQTIETINESSSQRQRSLDLFTSGRDAQWRNRLIWGDKKYVLPALLPEFAGKVKLIYIDPPFDTGADFSMPIAVGDGGEGFTKTPSIIEQKACRDTVIVPGRPTALAEPRVVALVLTDGGCGGAERAA